MRKGGQHEKQERNIRKNKHVDRENTEKQRRNNNTLQIRMAAATKQNTPILVG